MGFVKGFWDMCEDATIDGLIKLNERSAIFIKEHGIDEDNIILLFNEIIVLHIRAKEQGVNATVLYMLETKKIPTAQVAQKGL